MHRRPPSRVLVGALAIATLGLLGVGCNEGQRAAPRGVEIRDPLGRWHTYLPEGWKIDPVNPPRMSETLPIDGVSRSMVHFGVRQNSQNRDQDGRPAAIYAEVFEAPVGEPYSWYASELNRIWPQGIPSPGEATTLGGVSYTPSNEVLPRTLVIGQRSYFVYVDPDGLRGVEYFVTRAGRHAIRFRASEELGEILNFIIDHFEELEEP